jgi:hypothetical protein
MAVYPQLAQSSASDYNAGLSNDLKMVAQIVNLQTRNLTSCATAFERKVQIG